jgi:ABC-type uncharacterized transport system YnjBCD ATPase subunit
VAAGRGQHARAARLLGAAAAERKSIGAPRPPLERGPHERLMASLRHQLGDRVVDTAWRDAIPAAVVTEELMAAPRHAVQPDGSAGDWPAGGGDSPRVRRSAAGP